MVLVGLGLDASAHRMVSQPADRAIDIRLVTFHGYVNDQEMLLARQVRAADDTRTSSAGAPSASDLKRRVTEHGVAAIWQDARESLDYSVRTHYTKAGITYLQRTTTLPDGVRVRGSHCVTIGEAGGIRITFYPAARRPVLRGVRGGRGCAIEGGKPRARLGRDGRWISISGIAGGRVGEEGGDGSGGRGGRAQLGS